MASFLGVTWQLALGPAKTLAQKVMASMPRISVFDTDAIEKANSGQVKQNFSGRGYFGNVNVPIEDDRLFKGARDDGLGSSHRGPVPDESFGQFEDRYYDSVAGGPSYGGDQASHSRGYDHEDF